MAVIERLASMHEREFGVLTSSGTAALVQAIWALGLSGKRIAIPNNVCFSVPLAVYLSGNEPVWIDVKIPSMDMDADLLESMYRRDGYKYIPSKRMFDAVIAVHNYGVPCDIERISAFCAKEGIPLIEDCAVAQGASVNGKPVGSFGDISILSFGVGKIVQVDSGGGAVLTNDRDLASLIAHYGHTFASKGSGMDDLSRLHTHIYNKFFHTDSRKLNVFGTVAKAHGVRLLGRGIFHLISKDSILPSTLDALQDTIERRAEKAERFISLLQGCPNVEVIIQPEGSVYWRLNLSVLTGQQELLKYLWTKDFRASSWHPPSDLFWEERSRDDPSPIPVCDWLGDCIINLWVDDTVDDDYINQTAEAIWEFNEQVELGDVWGR